MAGLVFDTLKAARRLGDSGFSDEQAEALVGTMADSVAENLATKDDLKRLEAKIDALGQTMTIRLGDLVVAGVTIMAILDRIWAT